MKSRVFVKYFVNDCGYTNKIQETSIIDLKSIYNIHVYFSDDDAVSWVEAKLKYLGTIQYLLVWN